MKLSEFLKLWRVEKNSPRLARMPPNFYMEARELINHENPYDAKKARGIYDDIVHMRQHKMLMACLRELQGGDRPENLLAGEVEAYKKIFSELRAMRSGDIQLVDEESLGGDEETPQETLPEAEEDAGEKDEGSGEHSGGPVEGGTEEPVGEAAEEGPEKGLEKGQDEASGKESKESEEGPEGAEEPAEEPEPEEAEEPAEEGEKEEDSGKKEEEGPGEETEEDKKPSDEGEEEVFKEGTENKARLRVRFLKSMPAFVGPDLESLGPFEEDQVTELDAEVAEILINNDAVELV